SGIASFSADQASAGNCARNSWICRALISLIPGIAARFSREAARSAVRLPIPAFRRARTRIGPRPGMSAGVRGGAGGSDAPSRGGWGGSADILGGDSVVFSMDCLLQWGRVRGIALSCDALRLQESVGVLLDGAGFALSCGALRLPGCGALRFRSLDRFA